MKIFLAAFSLLLFAACGAQSSATRSASGPDASIQKALPVIAVNGSEIRINGTTVWLGDTLDAWKRVLGGAPICYDAGLIVSCVWHSNGLTLGTDHIDITRVKFMNLHITIEPPELADRAPSWPKSPFHGTLELDGAPDLSQHCFSRSSSPGCAGAEFAMRWQRLWKSQRRFQRRCKHLHESRDPFR